MNGWQSRATMLALFIGALALHAYCLSEVPNTPIGMLWFHFSAAGIDLALLLSAPRLLKDKLLDDTQHLCLWSIAVNCVGWILYMVYAPPYVYNNAQYLLCVAQWGRLFIADDGFTVNTMGWSAVCRHIHDWQKFYLGKKTQ